MAKYTKNIIIIGVASVIIVSLVVLRYFNVPDGRFKNEAVVGQVVDGDTIRLDDGRLIRYIGIDTPEIRKKLEYGWDYKPCRFSEEAKAYNKSLVAGKTIKLEYDIEKKDKFGRNLCYVYINNTMVNTKILEEGYGVISLRSPNLKYIDLFVNSQKEAIKEKKGLWKDRLGPVLPQKAKFYIGEVVTVEGKIKDIIYKDKVVVLEFEEGGLYLVVFKSTLKLFKHRGILADNLLGRRLQVYGIIKEYKDILEIIIDHPCQLKIIE